MAIRLWIDGSLGSTGCGHGPVDLWFSTLYTGVIIGLPLAGIGIGRVAQAYRIIQFVPLDIFVIYCKMRCAFVLLLGSSVRGCTAVLCHCVSGSIV